MPQRPARSANPYSGMTDEDLLARVQQIRQMAQNEAESSVTGRSHQGPVLERFPETVRQRPPAANVEQPPAINQQPYVQAEMLTNEARPPVPATGWRGIGESVLRGLASTGHPGGYHGYAADQQQVERQRQQDLLSRAQQLRGEGMARDRMNIEADRFNLTQSQTAEQNRAENDYRQRVLDIQGRPQAGMGAQGTYFQTGPEAGKVITPAPREPRADTSLQPFEAWRQQNPNAPVADWIALNRAPSQPREANYEWVIRAGEPTQILKGTAQRGDRPYDAVAERKPEAPPASPYAAERAARTIESIDELLPDVGHTTTGFGALTAAIPMTPARNFRARLDTLKANIAFNELTAMREASKSGGALGQVSNIELNLLQSALGALDQAQHPDDIRTQLIKIRDGVKRWQDAVTKLSGNTAVTTTDTTNTGQPIELERDPATGKLRVKR